MWAIFLFYYHYIKLNLHFKQNDMHTYYLHLGSNQGDRSINLKNAVKQIAQKCGSVTAESSIYETEPWGLKEQDYFLNLAIEVKSNISPDKMLVELQKIQQDMGPAKIEKWGPRIIDIDILYCDQMIMSTDELTIPHPRLHERSFVLTPLMEIAGDMIDPTHNMSIEDLYDICTDESEVVMWDED